MKRRIVATHDAHGGEAEDGIPVYDQEQLKGITYKVVLPLKATSCKQLPWDPSVTEEDVAAQMRFQARTARANGTTNASCSSKEGMSLTKNC